MNKDVIYIEPEDDITDIVTKIENSKEHIVAIVPPKKADILHSSINIKLMDKAGKNADKKLVLVTTDTVIIKHAASVKMPITKDLQSAPVVPTLEEIDPENPEEESVFDELKNKKKSAKNSAETEEIVTEEKEEDTEEPITGEEPVEETENTEKEETEEVVSESEATEETPKANKKDKKKAKKEKKEKNKEGGWFKKHRKWFFIGVPAVAIIVALAVWAFVIAPAVDVVIKISTDVDKITETINFTTKLEDENIDSGIFFLEEKKIEIPSSTEFSATGEKNVGDKAKGNVIVYAYFKESGQIAINANSSFTSDGLTFYSDEDVTLGYDKSKGSVADCSNKDDGFSLLNDGCLIYTRVNVTAAAPGSAYNIAQNNAWTTTANVVAYSDSNMTGGTDKSITVVQESDVEKAKAQLVADDKKEEAKTKLYEGIDENNFLPIKDSFKLEISDPEITPKVGEEIKGEEKAKISVKTSASIYVVDLTKIRDYIGKVAKNTDKMKETDSVCSIGNPFIENFTSTENGFTGRLKTSFTFGPDVSSQEIIDIIKGQRLGNVKYKLAEKYGENKVKAEINPSYPWVTSVPNDTNKITVTIKEE